MVDNHFCWPSLSPKRHWVVRSRTILEINSTHKIIIILYSFRLINFSVALFRFVPPFSFTKGTSSIESGSHFHHNAVLSPGNSYLTIFWYTTINSTPSSSFPFAKWQGKSFWKAGGWHSYAIWSEGMEVLEKESSGCFLWLWTAKIKHKVAMWATTSS